MDGKTSKKILAVAKQQQLEFNEENFPSLAPRKSVNFNLGKLQECWSLVAWFKELFLHLGGINEDDENVDVCENDFLDDLEIGEEDAKAFERFQNPDGGKRTLKLAQIIMDKIQEKQADIQSKLTDEGSLKIEDLDPRVKEMYEGVRDVMKRYRSGKVPKAFKIIPKLRNWEQILFITEPHNWSAAAMFQGARYITWL